MIIHLLDLRFIILRTCKFSKYVAICALFIILYPVIFGHAHTTLDNTKLMTSRSIPGKILYESSRDRFSSPPGLSSGKLLVASRKMTDQRFSEKVILLIKHDPDGSMGLIINRPTNVLLTDVLPHIRDLKKRADRVFIGGPVSIGQIQILFKTKRRYDEALSVFDNIFVTISQNVLQKLLSEKTEDASFRAYAGYAGWAPGQLDGEISRGDWHVLDAEPETVFTDDPMNVWHEMMRRISGQWWVKQE